MDETKTTRPIHWLIDHEHRIYLYFPSRDVIAEFQRRAVREGIRFGDGAAADARELRPVMRLLDDGTICYVGFAGMMAYHSRQADVLRVDVEKYLAGREDCILRL